MTSIILLASNKTEILFFVNFIDANGVSYLNFLIELLNTIIRNSTQYFPLSISWLQGCHPLAHGIHLLYAFV